MTPLQHVCVHLNHCAQFPPWQREQENLFDDYIKEVERIERDQKRQERKERMDACNSILQIKAAKPSPNPSRIKAVSHGIPRDMHDVQ